jgi:L-malate glycosyltransferase
MNILMVTMSMNIGGAETHILELSKELAERGHNITLASFGGVYADELQKLGVKCVTLPLHTKNPAHVMKSYMGLKKLICEGDFDIVHAHARIPGFIVGMLNDSLTENGKKFRFVTTAHLNFSVNSFLRHITRWGERVMAVSDDIKDYLVREYGFPEERIYTTINGIDTDKFSPACDFSAVLEKHHLERSRKRVVYVSRLDPDRAEPAYRIIDIAQELAKKFPDTDIIIVGGGSCFDELNGMAEKVNKAVGRNIVIMTGAVSNVDEYCAAADVFVGVSRSALEAMSAAKPVIIAGGQGALGIFDESKTEAAVNTNFCCRGYDSETNEQMLADIENLLENDELRERQGVFNREFIKKYYTASRMADDYVKMYEDTLKSPVCFKGKTDVVISGYYGFGNMGDESLLDIIASSLALEYNGIKIAALTKHPKEDRVRTGLKCVSRFNFFSVVHELAGAQALISGGGSLLQDKTSKRSLKYYAYVIKAAELLRKKVYVYANGIGPILYEANRKLTSDVVKKADIVTVRDSGSMNELVSLGVPREKITVSADPAFLIGERIGDRARTSADKLTEAYSEFFAVSVRPLNDTKLTQKDETMLAQTAAAVEKAAKRYGITPVIIPMQNSRDTEISNKLKDMLEKNGVDAPIYIPKSAEELICVLENADMVIGMRLHAVIFASSASTPVIGLSYDPKVEAFMKELGQDYCIDLSGEITAELEAKLTEYADDIMRNREKIKAEIDTVSAEMRAKAEEDVKRLGKIL